MTVTLESPTVQTVDYVVVAYRDGRRVGVEQFFGSMGEIKFYLGDSKGNVPPFTVVKSNEHIEDRKDLDGMVIEERAWLRRMGDTDLRGTRIYE